MIPQDPTLFTGTLRHNVDPFEEASDEQITELLKKAGLEYLFEGKSKKEIDDEEKEKAEKEEREKLFCNGDPEDDKDKEKEKDDKEKEKDKDEKKEDKDDDEKEDKDKDKKKEDEDDGKGLKFKVKENGNNLSIGEKQLICIVRAILRRNKIVILDEATANIDVVTEQKIQQLIQDEFKGATTFTIAHRLNTIIKSDKVLFLDKGQVLEFDSPVNLVKKPDSKFAGLLKDLKKAVAEGEEI